MRNNAHFIAVLFAATALLAAVGGCAITPVPEPAHVEFAPPYAPAAQSNSQPGSLQQPGQMSPAGRPQTVHRPPWTSPATSTDVYRGQNSSGLVPGGADRFVASDQYLRGPMAASVGANRDSRFTGQVAPARHAFAADTNAAPYHAAAPAYPTTAAGPAHTQVRQVQYDAPSPATPGWGGTLPGPAAAAQPGNSAVGQPGGDPGPVYVPGNGPWVDGNGQVDDGVVPYVDPVLPGTIYPQNTADMIASVQETHTGQFMFGVGVNSEAGLTGQIVISERNFDIWRPPTSWEDIANGTAFRGGGQGFRMEALPGTSVQRYMVSLSEPYLFNTDVSLNLSAYYFDRIYFDWDEQRYGGRLGLGYRLTPDLSVSASVRAERVFIHDPRVPAVWAADPNLNRALGWHDMFTARFSVARDKRDNYFSPTQGHYLELSYEQVFGSFEYSRGELDFRQYFLVRERPDSSGRQTLSFNVRFGVTGTNTPVFDNYFAGGYSTLRGFNFRGASPKTTTGGVIVGGRMRFLGSVEYMFPITADDMLRMVAFCDFGTVEQDIEMRGENFRVAPGVGLRIFVPAMGPAPIALDFAFPLAKSEFDDTQVFSFFVGFGR